jgi:hypothetical protein
MASSHCSIRGLGDLLHRRMKVLKDRCSAPESRWTNPLAVKELLMISVGVSCCRLKARTLGRDDG